MLIFKIHVQTFENHILHVQNKSITFFVKSFNEGAKSMKGNKINVTIRIDKDLWELAKMVLPCSRNAFIEKQLTSYLHSIDEISELEKEITQDKQDLQAKEEKLKHLKDIRALNDKNEGKIKQAMTTVFNIIQEHDEISQKQIMFIARRESISEEVLTKEIKKHKFKITKYTKEEREIKWESVKFF